MTKYLILFRFSFSFLFRNRKLVRHDMTCSSQTTVIRDTSSLLIVRSTCRPLTHTRAQHISFLFVYLYSLIFHVLCWSWIIFFKVEQNLTFVLRHGSEMRYRGAAEKGRLKGVLSIPCVREVSNLSRRHADGHIVLYK